MGTALSPLISEFETIEQQDSHTEWLRAKVMASLDDSRPVIAHDEVMAEMDVLIDHIDGLILLRIRSETRG